MSIKLILEVEIKPEAAAEMDAGMRAALPDTRAYDGCISIDVTRRDDNPNAWVIHEEWESKGHHERYIQWRTDTGFFEKWGPMMVGEPKTTYLNPVDM